MSEKPQGSSWAYLVLFVALLALIGVAVAYRVIAPFFHHH